VKTIENVLLIKIPTIPRPSLMLLALANQKSAQVQQNVHLAGTCMHHLKLQTLAPPVQNFLMPYYNTRTANLTARALNYPPPTTNKSGIRAQGGVRSHAKVRVQVSFVDGDASEIFKCRCLWHLFRIGILLLMVLILWAVVTLWHAFMSLGLKYFPMLFFLLGGLHCFFF
jgi:hypothetical protein